jgi:hypothetical protein
LKGFISKELSSKTEDFEQCFYNEDNEMFYIVLYGGSQEEVCMKCTRIMSMTSEIEVNVKEMIPNSVMNVAEELQKLHSHIKEVATKWSIMYHMATLTGPRFIIDQCVEELIKKDPKQLIVGKSDEKTLIITVKNEGNNPDSPIKTESKGFFSGIKQKVNKLKQYFSSKAVQDTQLRGEWKICGEHGMQAIDKDLGELYETMRKKGIAEFYYTRSLRQDAKKYNLDFSSRTFVDEERRSAWFLTSQALKEDGLEIALEWLIAHHQIIGDDYDLDVYFIEDSIPAFIVYRVNLKKMEQFNLKTQETRKIVFNTL